LNKKKKLVISNVIPTAEKTIFEKIYFYFFLILPIVYSDKIVDPVLIPRQIALTIFVLIIGVLIFYQISIKKINNDFRFLKSAFFYIFLLFNFTILISFFQSNLISESIYTFSKISLESLFLIFTCYLIIQKQLSVNSLAKSIFYLAIIVILISIFQLIKLYLSGNNFTDYIYEINSTIGHKNLLSSLLFIAFTYFFITFFVSKKWKILTFIVIIIVLCLIWILQTRTVLLAFIIFGFIFSILIFIKRNKLANKFSLKPIIIFSTILITLLSIFTFLNKEKLSRLFNIDSVIERISMWDNTYQIIQKNSLFGIGAGNWQIHFSENGLDKFPDPAVRNGITTFQRPHNDFLWVFSEAGIIGFLAYIAIFCILIYYLFRLFKNSENIKSIWLYSALIASISGYLFIALTDFPFERIEHQILLFLLFAIIFTEYYSKFIFSTNNKLPLFKLKYIVLLFIISTSTSFVVSSNRYQGELHNHLLYEAHKSLNWSNMIEEADKTQNDFYQIDPTSVPIYWYKAVAEFSLGNNLQAKLDFEKAYKIAPYNIHVLNNLATCYANLGQTKKAIKYFNKALSISSNFEESILNLSGLYYNNHDFKNAYLTILKCNENSTDPKYIKFLYPILTEKVNNMLDNEKDNSTKNKLIEIKLNYDELMKIFFDAKKNNVTFERYLLLNNKHE
jgi:O-antigen ligase/Tfp pilus assembly protein PilF